LMSRAPLLRSSPALGASSYGAVGIPDGDGDGDGDGSGEIEAEAEAEAEAATGTGTRTETGTTRSSGSRRHARLQRASFENGAPSSSAGPRRSYSFIRRRNSMYAERRNRRPSTAASDVGMGADSKFSF